MSSTEDIAVRTTNQERQLVLRLARVAKAVIGQWDNSHSQAPVADQQWRVKWVRRIWPRLAEALDALASLSAVLDDLLAVWPCPQCNLDVELIRAEVDPQTIGRHLYVAKPCGHRLTVAEAEDGWQHRRDIAVVPIDGSTLAAAERQRQLDKGYDLAHDAARPPGEQKWMTWCLQDAADPDAIPTDETPAMWPRSKREWAKYAGEEPLRLLIIAAALLHARIDRLLAERHRPAVS